MDLRNKRAARRSVVALLLATGLGGCVYAPPYAAYDPYYPAYPAYSYPAYVGPPVTLGFGFGYYRHHHHHHHGHGYYGGHGRHGWGHGGWRR
ncbi:hypothetical protein LPB04_04590 [Massilia litorea]|jgi:hypothetical protein|uniref:Lipoprotein n=1 Tax=Massilia litorea TaxID=2769491 RepID=A0A7L9U6C0_9BURK|nr:hypothetical protein LPB04_04590 [Massilia litorea]